MKRGIDRVSGDAQQNLIGQHSNDLADTPISNELMNQRSAMDYAYGDIDIWSSSALDGPVSKKLKNALGEAGSTTYGGSFEPVGQSFKMPSLDDINADNFPQTRPRINPNIRQRRMVKRIACDIPCISEYEIGILFSNPAIKTGKGTEIKYHGRDGSSTHKFLIEDDVLPVINIPTWNYYSQRAQLKMFKDDPDRYRNLDADEIWKCYSFEGVTKNEESEYGGESSINDGYNNDLNDHSLKGDGSKLTTEILYGPVRTYNIFQNCVIPGYYLYAIIKKFPCTKNFILSPKQNRNKEYAIKDFHCKTTEKFLPFQMALISIPEKTLPYEYLAYYDEKGCKKYGKGIRLGFVLFQPNGLPYAPPPEPHLLKPVCDASQGIRRTFNDHVTVVMDCRDGAYAM
jgi:hypothetical protein